MKAGRRISLALALSLVLFLPVAYADNTITLTSPNAQAGGFFGQSVAVNEGGPIVVVGAPQESAGTPAQSLAGHAYVLDTTTGLITTLTSPAPQTGGEFGTSVAVSGTTVVVGARLESAGTPAQPSAGNAYVFDATDGSLVTTLTSPNAQSNGRFGLSVAVSGTMVVVGAPDESAGTPAQPEAGHAYVFDATDGSLITTLTSPNAQANGQFGRSVAVSGTTVVVGAPLESAGTPVQTHAGHAYVFDATDGSLITTLTSPNAQTIGFFGFSVAVSGTTVVVGALGESAGTPAQTFAGHAYVFDASTGFLTPTTLTSPNAQTDGFFGLSVAVGGTTVVVGAPSEIVGLLTHAGHAYSFDASAGFLTTTLTSPNAQTNGRFGNSVAVTESDPIVVVGAPGESGGGSPAGGHAYVFFF